MTDIFFNIVQNLKLLWSIVVNWFSSLINIWNLLWRVPYGLEIKKHRRAQDSFKEKGYEGNFPIIRDHRGKDNERQITLPIMINKIAKLNITRYQKNLTLFKLNHAGIDPRFIKCLLVRLYFFITNIVCCWFTCRYIYLYFLCILSY